LRPYLKNKRKQDKFFKLVVVIEEDGGGEAESHICSEGLTIVWLLGGIYPITAMLIKYAETFMALRVHCTLKILAYGK
jgi:hypothetical protein